MKYMRDNLEDLYKISELQDKILEIAKYIDEFCSEHDIDYCLMGGSALGAKRHNGFIPWDDDLDIFMTPDNYEKFRDIFYRQGDTEKFYLQECGKTSKGYVSTPKLRMNGTTYIEELTKDFKMHQGIFVDIFILHNCPNSKLLQLWQCFWAKCTIVKGMSMRGYNRQTGIRKLFICASKLLPKKIMVDFALGQVYRFRNINSDYYCNFLGKAIFKKGIYDKDWFSQTLPIPFEKVYLRAPKGLHEFLTKRFGNYMVIPSADRIKWEQHAWKWSTTKDFSEYTNKMNDFSDEKYLV